MDREDDETLRFERTRLLRALRAPATCLARVIRANASRAHLPSREESMFEASEALVLRQLELVAKEERLRAELDLDPSPK